MAGTAQRAARWALREHDRGIKAFSQLVGQLAALVRDVAAPGRAAQLRVLLAGLDAAWQPLRHNVRALDRHLATLGPPGRRAAARRNRPRPGSQPQSADDLTAQIAMRLRDARRVETLWDRIRDRILCGCLVRQPGLLPALNPDLPGQAQARIAAFCYGLIDDLVHKTGQDSEAADSGAYADISLPTARFLALMQAAWRALAATGRVEGARFVDVGCGCGSKVLLAARFFPVANGLELDPGYAARARVLLTNIHCRDSQVFQENALNFDNYGSHDVIYFYQPIERSDLLIALEDRIIAQARPGTILIAPYTQFAMRAPGRPIAMLDDSVFIKGSKTRAQAVLRGVRRIGQRIPGPELLRQRQGHAQWQPLVQALRLTGFLD